jgi:hypothetical protein
MALLIGGVSMGDQVKALEKGVDVLIATPGRLMDLFERGNILLTGCSLLVIDEADGCSTWASSRTSRKSAPSCRQAARPCSSRRRCRRRSRSWPNKFLSQSQDDRGRAARRQMRSIESCGSTAQEAREAAQCCRRTRHAQRDHLLQPQDHGGELTPA